MTSQKAQEQSNGHKKLVGLLCLLFLLAGCAVRSQPQGQLTIRWMPDQTNTGKAAVEISGLNAASLEQLQKAGWDTSQWQRLLSVFAVVGDGGAKQNMTPMAGSYRLQSNVLRFEPQFPLEPEIN